MSRSNHRDFFWPPILKTFLILRDLEVNGAEGFAGRISGVDIEASFAQRPPSNWAAVWLSGEWLRLREGLSPFSKETLDLWLDTFFETHILTGQGLYQEPGHPNSYDLFTRYHLADMLVEGYDGRRREDLEILMRTGLLRSLGVQLRRLPCFRPPQYGADVDPRGTVRVLYPRGQPLPRARPRACETC